MARTLTAGGITVAIPDAAYWIDELQRSPCVQSIQRVFNGAPVVQESLTPGGDITLGGRANVWRWEDLRALLALRAYSTATLVWDGETKTCAWRRPQEIEFSPLLPELVDPSDDDLFRVTIRLFELPT